MNPLAKNPLGIRIVELPKCRMATSKPYSLEEFDKWWMQVDRRRTDQFFPRDFMYYDKTANELIWLYPLLPGTDAGKFGSVDFAGGLYAAAISKDRDDVDGEAVLAGIKQWVSTATSFRDAESEVRPVLFHVTTSDAAFAKLKYRQLDIYLPIE